VFRVRRCQLAFFDLDNKTIVAQFPMSGAEASPGSYLTVQDDGNLVFYSAPGAAWLETS